MGVYTGGIGASPVRRPVIVRFAHWIGTKAANNSLSGLAWTRLLQEKQSEIVRKALAGNCTKAYAKHNNSESVSASLLKKAERWARHGRCGKRWYDRKALKLESPLSDIKPWPGENLLRRRYMGKNMSRNNSQTMVTTLRSLSSSHCPTRSSNSLGSKSFIECFNS